MGNILFRSKNLLKRMIKIDQREELSELLGQI